MNSRNIKKEFEQFYYVMASNYNECWAAISSLDEIKTQYFACIEDELQNTIGTLMSDTICDNEVNAENAILHHK